MKHRLHALGVGVTILALMSITAGVSASEVYTVRKGDSLWSISKKFGVSIDDIKRANNVSANKPLQIGKKLVIPDQNQSQAAKEEAAELEAERQKKEAERFGSRVAKQLEEQDKAQAQAKNNTKDDGKPAVVRTALAFRGAKYVRGGTGARGFDCSGFTRHVFAKYGVNLPHSSKAQASCGKHVDKKDLQPGDLVFFATYRSSISHVGIYIGDNKFIHASTPRTGVIVSSLGEQYYAKRYRGARRVLANSSTESK
ncbi:MAG TPA: NlpC/P60 family protein [Armatimonadota bacterium]|nr:NlpC/P60 family protein [Armatimonadota bacterium]